MQKNSFREGVHEYKYGITPLTEGGWTTFVIHLNHTSFPPGENRIDGSASFPTEDEALAHAEAVAHDLSHRNRA